MRLLIQPVTSHQSPVTREPEGERSCELSALARQSLDYLYAFDAA